MRTGEVSRDGNGFVAEALDFGGECFERVAVVVAVENQVSALPGQLQGDSAAEVVYADDPVALDERSWVSCDQRTNRAPSAGSGTSSGIASPVRARS